MSERASPADVYNAILAAISFARERIFPARPRSRATGAATTSDSDSGGGARGGSGSSGGSAVSSPGALRDRAMRALGRALWHGDTGLCALLLAMLRDAIPHEAAELEGFSAVVRQTEAFEEQVARLGLLPPPGEDEEGDGGGEEEVGDVGGRVAGGSGRESRARQEGLGLTGADDAFNAFGGPETATTASASASSSLASGAAAAVAPAAGGGPPLDTGSTALSSFALEVDAHFAAKRRQTVLARGRELLRGAYHNTVAVDPRRERARLLGEGAARAADVAASGKVRPSRPAAPRPVPRPAPAHPTPTQPSPVARPERKALGASSCQRARSRPRALHSWICFTRRDRKSVV